MLDLNKISINLCDIAEQAGFPASAKLNENAEGRITRIVEISVTCGDDDALTSLAEKFRQSEDSCRHVNILEDPGSDEVTLRVQVAEPL